MKGKRHGFRMFPGRLPQSWMTISHGAQGLAFHWWRVFEGETVSVPAERIAAAVGLQPEARRYVARWLDEMVSSGALERVAGGGLRMTLPIPGRALDERSNDAGRTLVERSSDVARTLVERCSDAGRTLVERSTERKAAESLDATAEKVARQTDRSDRQTDGSARTREEPPVKPHPLRLRPLLEECVRAEFARREIPRQGAGHGQWEEACKRVDDALALRSFGDAQEACEALARAAVEDALKPGGKFGLALLQAQFVGTGKLIPLSQRRIVADESV